MRDNVKFNSELVVWMSTRDTNKSLVAYISNGDKKVVLEISGAGRDIVVASSKIPVGMKKVRLLRSICDTKNVTITRKPVLTTHYYLSVHW